MNVFTHVTMVTAVYYVLAYMPLSLLITIGGTILLTCAMYFTTILCKSSDMQLFYKHSELTRHLLKSCKLLSKSFNPPFWIRNAHVQTVLQYLLPRSEYYFRRQYLMLRDRGIIALDWGVTGEDVLRKKNAIMVVIPDVTGDAGSVSHLCHAAFNKGMRVVVFNRRGHGGSPLTTPRLCTFGDPVDLRQAVKYITGLYPTAKVTAVSIGAGSGLLLSYLGEYGSSTHLSAAACISPLYDAEVVYGKPLPQPYDLMRLLRMNLLLSGHYRTLSKSVNIEDVARCRSLPQFEDLVFCRQSGSSDMTEYWDNNNPMREVDEISVPLICINSLDDPIYSANNIPYDLFTIYPNFLLVLTELGGHCGFLQGGHLMSWANKLVLEYLAAVMKFSSTEGKNNFIAR